MARLFDDASSQHLIHASPVVSSLPLTISAWVKSDTNGQGQYVVDICDNTNPTSGYIVLYLKNDNTVSAATYPSYREATTTNSWSAGTLHHVAGVFATTRSRAVYIDGGGKGTDTALSTPASLEVTVIGAGYWAGAIAGKFSGSIAEVGIWNVVLTDAEVATLATGVSPRSVRPESLVFYAPLWRDEDEDFVGGLSLTAVNTPTVAAHPRVFYLATPQVGKTAAAGGSPSASESASESASGSASLSPSASESASESASISPSVSESASASASGSASASASESTSGSASGSASSSASGSASGSASPSPSPVAISVVWGHDTDVIEDTVRDFENNWTGTGTIENAGVSDTERLALDAEEYMISEIADTGAVNIVIGYNTYTEGDIIDLDYRHGATPTACEEAAWNNYTGQFTSLGYVQIRVTNA